MAEPTIKVIPNGPYRVDGPDEGHGPAGQRDRRRGRTRDLALPVRRLGEQTVLRRNSRQDRFPGLRAGGEVIRTPARA